MVHSHRTNGCEIEISGNKSLVQIFKKNKSQKTAQLQNLKDKYLPDLNSFTGITVNQWQTFSCKPLSCTLRNVTIPGKDFMG